MLFKWYQILLSVAHFWSSPFVETFGGDGAVGGLERNNPKVPGSTTPPPKPRLWRPCADLCYSLLNMRVGLEGGKGEEGKGDNCKPLCDLFSLLGVAWTPLEVLLN